MNILIADDNDDVRDVISMVAAMHGHDVMVAHDGATALDILRTLEPDAAILDVGMGEMSGLDVARLARHSGVRTHLIALSGWSKPSDAEAALDAGFDVFLGKPASIEQINEALARRKDRT